MIKKAMKTVLSRLGLKSSWASRAFQSPRIWSNAELLKISGELEGKVINVSAWEDRDKEGRLYRDYFPKSSSYDISNYGTDQGVLQHTNNEIFLDLQEDLPHSLLMSYDVVFNHTTLEHIYDFRAAFANICALSRDLVIIVVPWLQPMHTNYGDYWRFSPQALALMFQDEGFTTLYISWNKNPRSSVYVFAIATRNPTKWGSRLGHGVDPTSESFRQLPLDFAGKVVF